MNIKKTNFKMFSLKRKIIRPNNLQLLIDNVPIEQVDKTKFLGPVINFKLNLNDHITTLCTKISKNTGIIFTVRHNLNKNTVLLLYRSLIQPYLDYCNIIWATVHSNNLERLFRKHKNFFALLLLLNLLLLAFACLVKPYDDCFVSTVECSQSAL